MESFEQALRGSPLMLAEGSVYERVRRVPGIEFDPSVAHAGLIYDQRAAGVLTEVHRDYIAVAREAGLPMLVSTGTWRASRERLSQSAFAGSRVNQDHVAFVRSICAGQRARGARLWVGGVLGPRGDGYRADDAPDAETALRYHAPQAKALAQAGADVLTAVTLPALPEALGLARAMAETGLPYLVSVVVRRTGTLLDGTPLGEALQTIDEAVTAQPLGYSINCVHPRVALDAVASLSASAFSRLLGFNANAATRRGDDPDDGASLTVEEPEALGRLVAAVQQAHRFRLLGGCCGTSAEHLRAIVEHCAGMGHPGATAAVATSA